MSSHKCNALDFTLWPRLQTTKFLRLNNKNKLSFFIDRPEKPNYIHTKTIFQREYIHILILNLLIKLQFLILSGLHSRTTWKAEG